MKKIRLNLADLGATEILTREQLKSVFGGTGSGSGSSSSGSGSSSSSGGGGGGGNVTCAGLSPCTGSCTMDIDNTKGSCSSVGGYGCVCN